MNYTKDWMMMKKRKKKKKKQLMVFQGFKTSSFFFEDLVGLNFGKM